MPSANSIGVVTICRPAQEFSERLSVGVLGVAIGGEVGAQSAEFFAQRTSRKLGAATRALEIIGERRAERGGSEDARRGRRRPRC